MGDLDASFAKVNKKKWKSYVSVLILDQDGEPVAGATVRGTWDHDSSEETATTDDTGKAVLENKKNLAESSSQFTIKDVNSKFAEY